jgi:hypothetical protein
MCFVVLQETWAGVPLQKEVTKHLFPVVFQAQMVYIISEIYFQAIRESTSEKFRHYIMICFESAQFNVCRFQH